ncbi:MAG: hypothetical protein CMJ26_00225 [Phycisphaerae bacterium]|nr:hypothetical protein [Phycisphaerae bacterium]|tara:strand:- start:3475 stop:3753 length:279 start_codon:yes stop_codon:yes gene_type:complete
MVHFTCSPVSSVGKAAGLLIGPVAASSPAQVCPKGCFWGLLKTTYSIYDNNSASLSMYSNDIGEYFKFLQSQAGGCARSDDSASSTQKIQSA